MGQVGLKTNDVLGLLLCSGHCFFLRLECGQECVVVLWKLRGRKTVCCHIWAKGERCRKMGLGWGVDRYILKGDKCFGAKHLQPITWSGRLSPVWLDGSPWRADPLPVSGFYYCCYDADVMSSGQKNTCITALLLLAWVFQLPCSDLSVF